MRCGECGTSNREDARFCAMCGQGLAGACPACGAELLPTARFCDSCGRPAPGATERRPPPDGLVGGRYELAELLGQGAHKDVYLAHDRRLGRDVALALLRRGLGPEALARFQEEATSLAGLGDHPNLVTVYDAGEEEERPWVASRLMHGGTVAELLEAMSEVPVTRAVQVAADVAAALGHVHDNGLVHRDVKAANVWLADDGTAVLGDFGLALPVELLGVGSVPAGTVGAMPPEAIRGQATDHRADLYALGVLLYQMLTGRPPFVGDDAAAVLAQHATTPPMTMSLLRPEVPHGLDALVTRLLAKDPDDRPRSAGEVVALLEQSGREQRVVVATPPAQAGGTRLGYVGRQAELGALSSAVDAALAGQGGLVLLTGEPGIGKTRTAEEVAAEARRRGSEVLWGRCHEGEAVVPYLPFIEPLRTWAVARSSDRVAQLLGEHAPALAALLPDLAAHLPDVEPASGAEDPEGDRARLFDAVSAVFVRSSRQTPLLLVLDDLHWADRASLQLLVHLTRGIAQAAVLVVATYRDVEVGRRHPLGDVLEDLRREHLGTRIALRGLSSAEIATLLEETASHELGSGGHAFAEALHERTEGNPFFVEEIVRDLLESGAIYQRDGRWTSRPVEELRIPEGVRQVIGRRLSRLSEQANTVLADGAVLGRSFSFEVLAAMGPYDRDELAARLAEAQAANLVVATGTTGEPSYAFTHALVRETLYEELALPEAQRRHLAAGRALEDIHASSLDSHAAELAAHFRAAGAAADSGTAIRWSIRAAELAAGVFAWEESLEHLEAALDLVERSGGDLAVQAALRERLGDLRYVAGLDLQRGIAHLERALALYESLGDARRVAQVHSRLGRSMSSFTETMDVERALEHFRAAEAYLGQEADSAALGYVHAGLASAAIYAHLPEEGAASGEQAMAIAKRLGRDSLWASAATSTAWNLAHLGRLDEAFELIEEAGSLGRSLNHSFAAFQAVWIDAAICLGTLDYERSARVTKEELESPRTAQAPRQQATLRAVLAAALLEMGELAACARVVGEGVDDPLFTCRPAIGRGDWEEATRTLEEGVRRYRAAKSPWMEQSCVWTLARVAEWQGRTELAYERFAEHGHLLRVDQFPWSTIWWGSDMARIAAKLGRVDEARRHLATLEKAMTLRAEWEGNAGLAWSARASVAAAEDDVGRAMRAFAEALRVFHVKRAVLFELTTLRTMGTWLLERGDAAEAETAFAQALERLERHGFGPPWHAEFHTLLLRARGVGPEVPLDASIDLVASSVRLAQPDLRPHAAPDGTLTILFTDIEGSTALGQRLGDQEWVEVIRRHNALVRKAVAKHGGFEVKALGDGFMLVFPSAARALRCAQAIRQGVAAEPARNDEPPLGVRIGVHTGEPIADGGDFYGSQVNLAARLAAQAGGGQIVVSDLTRRLVAGDTALRFGPEREVEVKGFPGAQRMCDLL